MFTRTDAGLESEHLFYNVDWVVYCEGSEVEGEVASLDEAFWTTVFETHGLSCKCKSFGSKLELHEIAEKVSEENVDGILVAFDRDYDHLTGTTIDHPRVLYTHGYSWETDACQDFSVRRVVQLFANIIHTETIEQEFNSFQQVLSQKLKRIFALDFKYYNHSESLFDRSKPLSIIEVTGAEAPAIRKKMLLEKAKNLPRHEPRQLREDQYRTACGFTDFFGKAISRMVFHWFVKRTSGLAGRRRAYYDAFMMTVVGSMKFADNSQPKNQHYEKMLAAITN